MKFVPFMDVCDIQGGTQPPKSEWLSSPADGYVRMLQIRDFTQPDNPKVEYVKDKGSLKKCDSDDILIARYGASIGRILTGLSGAYNVAMAKCKYDKERVDRQFLFHWLNSDKFQNSVSGFGGRAAQAGFNKKDLSGLELPLPTMAEQKRIATILDTTDSLRGKRRESLAQLDALMQSTFLDLFGDQDSWSSVTFESVAENGRSTFSNGPFGSDLLTSELQESGVPVIYIRDIRGGVYYRVSGSHVADEKAAKLSACQVRPKDVLIAKVGDPPGTAALYPDNEPLGVVTQDVIRIRVDEQVADPIFIVGYLNSDYGKRKLAEITVKATRARFGLRDLKQLTFPLPPKGVQKSYSEVAVKIAMQKNALANHMAELDSLFSALQQKAFSGEL